VASVGFTSKPAVADVVTSTSTSTGEDGTEGCVKGKIDIGGMLFTFFGCDDIRVPPGK